MSSLPLRLALGLCLCLSGLPAWATLSNAEALNLAGQQRMLSQRIAKSYLMLGSQVRPDVANQQLDQSLASFESNQQALDDYAPTATIRQQLHSASQLWQDYRQLALSPADQAHAMQLLAQADVLLAQSEQLVSLIEAHAGGGTAHHNAAGELVGVVEVQRLAQFKHDVVGNVHRQRDGADAGQAQP